MIFGYKDVFARQNRGLAQPGDLVIVFTSSGDRENILRALGVARRLIWRASFLGAEAARRRTRDLAS